MKGQLDQLLPAPLRYRDDRLPDLRNGGEPRRVVVVAGLVEVREAVALVEPEPVVVLVRQPLERLVLEDEVAEAVQDRCALVDLDGAQRVRSVSHEDRGAGIHHRPREGDQELGGLHAAVGPRRAFVGVDRHHHVVGLAAGVAHDHGDLRHVLGVRLGAHAGRVGKFEPAAEEVQAVPGRGRVHLEVAHGGADALELFAGDLVGRLEAEGIQAGPRGNVVARLSGDRVVGIRRGKGDHRDPAVLRLDELGFPGFREAASDPRGDDARFPDVLLGEEHRRRPVVPRVVVGQRPDVDSGPDELLHEFRLGAHVGPAARTHGIGLPVVEEDLHVGERQVGAPQEIDHRQELGLLVDAQFAGDDRIARQRHGEAVLSDRLGSEPGGQSAGDEDGEKSGRSCLVGHGQGPPRNLRVWQIGDGSAGRSASERRPPAGIARREAGETRSATRSSGGDGPPIAGSPAAAAGPPPVARTRSPAPARR